MGLLMHTCRGVWDSFSCSKKHFGNKQGVSGHLLCSRKAGKPITHTGAPCLPRGLLPVSGCSGPPSSGLTGYRRVTAPTAASSRSVLQVPVQSWFDDMTDTELLDLIPFFEGLSREDDVYSMLHRLCSR